MKKQGMLHLASPAVCLGSVDEAEQNRGRKGVDCW